MSAAKIFFFFVFFSSGRPIRLVVWEPFSFGHPNIVLPLYRVIQDLCDKLWGLIELTIRNIFCWTTNVLWRVVLKQTLVLCYDLIFILLVEKNYRMCSKCVPCTWLHSLHHHTVACRTLVNMLGMCLIWSNAVTICSISSCLVLTGLMYTTLFTCLQRKKN